MELEITTNYLQIQSKLDSLITEKNISDIKKVKKNAKQYIMIFKKELRMVL
jgi:hypothetical protein